MATTESSSFSSSSRKSGGGRKSAAASSSSSSSAFMFEDRFILRAVDWSRFENILRVRGKSAGFDAELILDVHSQLFPVKAEESVHMGLTMNVCSNTAGDTNDWQRSDTILEDYDYAMYVRIFKMEEKTSDRRTVYASFGGLIMSLTADKHVLGELQLDMRLYLLMRRSEDIVLAVRN
eukprot:GHVS01034109.1.p1 GENE.GHVS01034109.1~~GHVS01034109.1.p1  ORF type:complete len:178 (+),score=31.93 GHVS01034109.1:107-640(+)